MLAIVAAAALAVYGLQVLTAPRTEDRTVGVSRFCPKHNVEMRKVRDRIMYGMLIPTPSPPHPDVVDSEFPYGEVFADGGCDITINSPEVAVFYVCRACERARADWYAREYGKASTQYESL
jgi:hypothetical protein